MADDIRPDELARYLAGEAGPAEAERIRRWLDAHPEARAALDGAPPLPEGQAALRDPEAALAALHDRIRKAPEGTPANRPADRPAVRRSSRRTRVRVWASAAVVVVALLLIVIARSVLQAPPEAPTAYRDLVTERGQRLVIALADGSSVELNAASSLRVPVRFDADRREVILVGEAYFDIAPDADRPFIIRSEDAVVRVLGTSFNVTAYPGSDRVDVVVAEGRVAFRVDADSVVLHPGQHGSLTRPSPGAAPRLAVADVDPEPFLAWRQGRLVFRNTPLDEVARALERRFDVDIELEGEALATRRLDAEFDNQALLDVLDALAFVLDVEYRQEDLDAAQQPRRIVLYAPS